MVQGVQCAGVEVPSKRQPVKVVSLAPGIRLSLTLGAFLFLVACAPPPPVPVPEGNLSTIKCHPQTIGGFPLITSKEKAARTFFGCRTGWAVAYNPSTRVADWVTARLEPAFLIPNPQERVRTHALRSDPFLHDTTRTIRSDLETTGYRWEQWLPAETWRYDEVVKSRSHYLSNAYPQHPGQQAVWGRLHSVVRGWLQTKNTLFVIAGPVYQGGEPSFWVGPVVRKKGRQAIPSASFMVIHDPVAQETIAFLVPNQAVPEESLARLVVRPGDIEQHTGLTLFPAWSPEQRHKALWSVTPAHWPLRPERVSVPER